MILKHQIRTQTIMLHQPVSPHADPAGPASAVERQARLLTYIQSHQRISVPQVVEAFAISVATARRDLDALAERGQVQRVHGGAIALQQAPPEPPVVLRADEQALEKRRIGQVAAALVKEGETVFLGTGSTVLEVARALRGRTDLTVITNSIPVVNMLAGSPGIALVCLGGELRKSEMSLIGHIAEQALAELRTSRVILGIRAIDLEHGLTNEYLQESTIDRAILKIGPETMVVADHTKCGRVSTAFVAPTVAMHTLVTDSAAPETFVQTLRAQGVRVVLA